MPLAGFAAVRFTIANTLAVPSAVHFQVDNPERTADTVSFEISTAVIDSWDAPAIWFRPRVKVAGEWVPDAELGAVLEGEDVALDTHAANFSFTVLGRRWGIHQTEKVYSRGTPVEVYFDHGRADLDAVLVAEQPAHFGYVVGCDQRNAHEPVVTVHCRDASARYDKHTLCEEYEALTGMNRRQITEQSAASIGIPFVDAPDGAVYDKPLQLTNKRPFDFWKEFWEPEGGCVRMRDWDTLQVRQPRLKHAPLGADYTWRRGSWTSLTPVPPEDCPSRWLVHATRAVIVDELGVETEMSVHELKAEYSLKAADQYQDGLGVTTPTGLPTLDPVLIVVRRLEIQTARRGGKVVSQIERESKIYNPRHAKWVTDTAGAGDVGGGFDYVASFIADGKYVAWPREKLTQVSEKRLTNFYTGPYRTHAGTYIELWGWTLQTMGVRTVGADPDETTCIGAFVYDDDQSYSTLQEAWGRREAFDADYEYAGDPGAMLATTQDTYKHYSPKCRVDGAPAMNRFVLYDGTGQVDLIAPWKHFERKVTSDIVVKNHVVGRQEAKTSWSAPKRAAGVYDWGNDRSDAESEEFGTQVEVETTAWTATNENQVSEEGFPAEGGRDLRIYMGKLPSTLYGASIWTDLQMQPIEVVVDDSTAQEWFGFERRALIHEYVQSETEALMVIDLYRKPRMSPKETVVRPDTAAEPGATVHLIDEEQGINIRRIVLRKSRRVDGPVSTATYLLGDYVA